MGIKELVSEESAVRREAIVKSALESSFLEFRVPDMDWTGLMKGPWTFGSEPKVMAEMEVSYANETVQRLAVVGKNLERGEIYAFYGGKRDIAHFMAVKFDYIVDINETKAA